MLYLVSDHAGYEFKKELIKLLENSGIENVDLNPNYNEKDDYPDPAIILADKLKNNEKSFGIAICGSGQGICMAMNRHSWIRAGWVNQKVFAEMIREHNHANVICFPGRYLDPKDGLEFTKAFLNHEEDLSERHSRRVEKLSKITCIR